MPWILPIVSRPQMDEQRLRRPDGDAAPEKVLICCPNAAIEGHRESHGRGIARVSWDSPARLVKLTHVHFWLRDHNARGNRRKGGVQKARRRLCSKVSTLRISATRLRNSCSVSVSASEAATRSSVGFLRSVRPRSRRASATSVLASTTRRKCGGDSPAPPPSRRDR